MDNLVNRGGLIQGSNLNCALYEVFPETCSHLFFSCKMAYKIWLGCYKWLGIQTVLPQMASDHWRQHMGLGRGLKRKLIWQVIWFSVIWIIWKNRNNKIFDGAEMDLEKTQ